MECRGMFDFESEMLVYVDLLNGEINLDEWLLCLETFDRSVSLTQLDHN